MAFFPCDLGGNELEEIKNTLGYTAGKEKNLLENTGEGYSSNGVTFIVNEDGSVTVNGTPTINKAIVLNSEVKLPKGEYILSGCPEGGSESTYYLDITVNSNTIKDVGSGITFVVNKDTTVNSVRVYVVKGTTFENVTFYPMIRKASVTDDTYESYRDNVDTRLDSVETNLATKCQMEIMSYDGKGTYGSSNPTSVTFSFAPRVIYILGYQELNNDNQNFFMLSQHALCDIMTTAYKLRRGFSNTATIWMKKSSDGKTISWYETVSANNQFNQSNYKYHVMAIG